MAKKKCSKCKTPKSIGEFSSDTTRKDGLQAWCKVCKSKYNQEYAAKPENKKTRKKRYNERVIASTRKDALDSMCQDIKSIAQELQNGQLKYPTNKNPAMICKVEAGKIIEVTIIIENSRVHYQSEGQ